MPLTRPPRPISARSPSLASCRASSAQPLLPSLGPLAARWKSPGGPSLGPPSLRPSLLAARCRHLPRRVVPPPSRPLLLSTSPSSRKVLALRGGLLARFSRAAATMVAAPLAPRRGVSWRGFSRRGCAGGGGTAGRRHTIAIMLTAVSGRRCRAAHYSDHDQSSIDVFSMSSLPPHGDASVATCGAMTGDGSSHGNAPGNRDDVARQKDWPSSPPSSPLKKSNGDRRRVPRERAVRLVGQRLHLDAAPAHPAAGTPRARAAAAVSAAAAVTVAAEEAVRRAPADAADEHADDGRHGDRDQRLVVLAALVVARRAAHAIAVAGRGRRRRDEKGGAAKPPSRRRRGDTAAAEEAARRRRDERRRDGTTRERRNESHQRRRRARCV